MAESKDQVRNQRTHRTKSGTERTKKGTERVVAKCPKCGDQTLQAVHTSTREFASKEVPTCVQCLILRADVVELTIANRAWVPPTTEVADVQAIPVARDVIPGIRRKRDE